MSHPQMLLHQILLTCLVLTVKFCDVAGNLDDVKWVARHENPSELVSGGKEGNWTTFVARTEFNAEVIPGKQVGNEKVIWFSYNGLVVSKVDDYELLVDPEEALDWESADDGLPDNIFDGGRTETGTPICICRASVEGTMMIGNVLAETAAVCKLPFEGDVHERGEFEVLVEKKGMAWWVILLLVLGGIFALIVIILLCIFGKLYKAFQVCADLVEYAVEDD